MIRVIVAVDRKFGIAKAGMQPWHIPDDEAYFSRQTKTFGANVLMGNTTLKTMGKSLKGRTNYVLSRSTLSNKDVVAVNNLEKCLEEFGDDNLWIIGGASLYEQVLGFNAVDELYITHIDANFNCDKFFPQFDATEFNLQKQTEIKRQNGFAYTYAVYKKVAAVAAI